MLCLALSALVALQAPAATAPSITRETLAAAYLDIDAAYTRALHDCERTAELNRGFDSATFLFFSGRQAELLKALRQLRWTIEPPASPTLPALSCLGAEASPRVSVPGTGAATLTVGLLTEPPEPRPEKIALRLVHSDGATRPLDALPMPAQGAAASTALDLPPDGPFGRWTIEVADGAAPPEARAWRAIGVLRTAPEAPSALASKLAARLDAVTSQPALEQAIASARARLRLLVDEPSTTLSSQFLADPAALATALDQEIAALAEGRNPYAQGHGDLWRVVRAAEVDMPVRIVVPEKLPPQPGLIIALHGAGGDESMFVDGYGAGRAVELAAKHGFILAAPSTTSMTISPAFFDGLVDLLVAERNVDPRNIHVIGHSMGAAAATRLATLRPQRIASYTCIAGGAGFPTATPPEGPTGLVIAARLDPLIQANRIRDAVAKAKEAGAVIEFREYPSHGHTFVVNDALAEVFEWIAGRPKPEP